MIQQPELGKKIANLRKAKGFTQEELVEKCNLNVRTLQRIESGEATPRTYTLKLIFEALEYPIDNSSNDNGLILKWLEQFYISFIDLFNLKTNTMKKVSILSFILTLVVLSVITINSKLNAQNIKNQQESGRQSEKEKDVYSITPKVNYLFNWALNPLNINLPAGSDLETNNGIIKRIEDDIFVIPYQIGELKITSNINDSEICQNFEVLSLPNPKFKIGGEILKIGSKISVSNLTQNKNINVYYGAGLEIEFNVFEYAIFYNQDQSDEEKFVVKGNSISTQEIDLIKRGLKENKEVAIDYISLRMPDGYVRYYGSFKIED